MPKSRVLLLSLFSASIAAAVFACSSDDDAGTPMDGGGVDGAHTGEDATSDTASGEDATSDTASGDDATSDSASKDAASGDANAAQDVAVDSAPTADAADAGPDSAPLGPYVYFGDNINSAVAGFSMSTATGTLTQIDMNAAVPGTQSLLTGGPRPFGVAAFPNGKYVYAVFLGTGGKIGQFKIEPTTGVLTRVDTDLVTAGQQDFSVGSAVAPYAIMADPKGRVLYVSDSTDNQLITLSVNATTGALAVVSTITTATTSLRGLAVDPAANFIYLLSAGIPPVDTRVSLDPTTGIPSAGPLSDGGYARGTITGSGTCISGALGSKGELYTACSQDQSIHGLAYNAGTGTLVSIGSANASNSPIAVAVHPNGKFAYTTSFTLSTMSTFSLDSSGAPTIIGTPNNISAQCRTLAFDSSGKYLYAGCDGKMVMFTVDATTGAATNNGFINGVSDSTYAMAFVSPSP